MFVDQFSSAARLNLESHLSAADEIGNKAFAGIAKLVDLNLAAARATLEESAAAAKQLVAAKDPNEVFTFVAAQAQPAFEKAVAYSRNFAGIASATQAELAKAAEEQATAVARNAVAALDGLAKNAPPGFEQAFAAFKNSLATASAGCEQFNKFSAQANEAIKENFEKLFSQAEKAGRARK